MGIDAGSTTTKVALASDKGELLYSFYAGNEGNPLKVVIDSLNELYDSMPEGVKGYATPVSQVMARASFKQL